MCKGMDLDDVFAYDTVKIVRVRDRVLGITRLLFLLAIALYIGVYVIYMKQAYNDVEDPEGAATASLLKPNVLTPVDQSYCLDTNDPNGNDKFRLNCTVWDATQMLYPTDSFNSMFITTRVSQDVQTAQCVQSTPCLDPWLPLQTNNKGFFMAGIKNYTIRVIHSAQARRFADESGGGYNWVNTDMKGALYDVDGNVMKEFDKQQSDIFTIHELVTAGGVRLDDPTDVPGARDNESKRSAGVILLVTLLYSNKDSDIPTYKYEVRTVARAEYKVLEAVYLDANTRLLNNRHGIKVVFMQSGTIVKFSIQTTLVQLMSALGLLSVATVLVEVLMLHGLKYREQYKKYKVEMTEDFSDVRLKDLQERLDFDQLNQDLQQLRRDSFGTLASEPLAPNRSHDRDQGQGQSEGAQGV